MGSRTSFIVQVSKPSVYQFSVIYNGNTYAFGPSWDGQWNSNFYQDILLQQVKNVSYAVDQLNASSKLSIRVLLCAWLNRRNCTLNGSIYVYAKNVVHECSEGLYMVSFMGQNECNF